MRNTLLSIVLLWFYLPVWGNHYYVSQLTGNDQSAGTSKNTAFKTIQRAADIVMPGDVVHVLNGVYTNACAQCDVVNITRSGTPAAWITFINEVGQTPVIQFNGWNGFKLGDGAAYIVISGFEIIGNNANVALNDALNQPGSCANPGGSSNPLYNGSGISSDGRNATNKPHHLLFEYNTIHDCGGAGISAIQSDYITVNSNLVYNNSWYTIYGTSGISFWQLWNSDGTNTTHNFVQGNRCFGNRLYVPWIGLCQITDGNGIIIDDSRNTQNGSTLGAYTAGTEIANNLVWNNGGSGIHTYESEHVAIFNNTAYHNSQSSEIDNGEIFANSSNDVLIYNNILWAADLNKINSNYNNTNLSYDYNLHWGGTSASLTGPHTIFADPLMINPGLSLTADFELKPLSPAVDAGDNSYDLGFDIRQYPRPYGPTVDMGAYEYINFMPIEKLQPASMPVWVYPHPISSQFEIGAVYPWDHAVLQNVLGQKVAVFTPGEGLSLAELSPGIYALSVFRDKQTPPIVVRVRKE